MILGSNHTAVAKKEHGKFMKDWHENNPHPKGMLGKLHSKETKKKMRKANKGRGAGRTVSNITKKRLSTTRKKLKLAIGKKNPNYKAKIEKFCLYCGMIFYVIPSRSDKAKYHNLECRNLADKEKEPWNKGLTVIEDSRVCALEKNGRWLGGKSFEPYGIDFNEELREKIRKRDNYQCQYPECGSIQNGRKFPVHHSDYNKSNNDELNLITLCSPHHSAINKDRNYWKLYFKNLQKERFLCS